MDESWRCTMGSMLPRRQSSEQHAAAAGHQSLAPDDFRDVFGGPPRTVLLRSFYGEGVEYHSPSAGNGGGQYLAYGRAEGYFFRRPYVDGGRGQLAAAPAAVPTEEGFFDDIFGARHMRSRSRSKSTKSSSVVSSEELGPGLYRPAAGGGRGDATLSSFASKLRPIAIPSRRYDSSPPSTASTRGEYQSSFTCSTAAYPASRQYYYGGGDLSSRRGRKHSSVASSNAAAESSAARHHHRSFCCFTAGSETTSHEPSFRRARGRADERSPAPDATDDTTTCSRTDVDYGGYYYYSPPSAALSSAYGNPLPLPRTPRMLEEVVMEVRERAPLLMDDGDAEIDSVGAAAVDEAIAWAKERFWSHAK